MPIERLSFPEGMQFVSKMDLREGLLRQMDRFQTPSPGEHKLYSPNGTMLLVKKDGTADIRKGEKPTSATILAEPAPVVTLKSVEDSYTIIDFGSKSKKIYELVFYCPEGQSKRLVSRIDELVDALNFS